MKATNKEKALAALLKNSTISEAAKDCGLSAETIYRYLKDKEFISDYRNARRQVVENSITQLQQASGEAVETLRRNLSCSNPQAEIRAAQIILDNALKGVELVDILERLETIENEYQKQIEEDGKQNNRKRF
jgi:AcrR family transcriptional regulator